MKWYNALIDEHPEHGQHVLISVDGVYYMAVYDGGSKHFVLREESSKVISPASDRAIYWAHLDMPGNSYF